MATWYKTGTVSVTNGGATVTGAGTAFVANVKVGDEFRLEGAQRGYEVVAVNSDTQLTIDPAYLDSTQTAQAYRIVPTRGVLKATYDALTAALSTIQGYIDGPLSGLFSAGSAGEPGVANAVDTNTGIYWPATDQLAAATNGIRRWLLTTSEMAFDVPVSIVGKLKFQNDGADAILDKFTATGALRVRTRNAADTAQVETLTITNGQNVGIGHSNPSTKLAVLSDSNTSQNTILYNTATAFTGRMFQVSLDTVAGAGYNLIYCTANGTADPKWRVRGDGGTYADAAYNSSGADYAEYFEWADGNPLGEDRRGLAVVLDGGQIRPALDGDAPIGVISGNPSVIGDSDNDKWTGKYLRDDFGTVLIDEDGALMLNPAYDPDLPYTSREDRPEWAVVGLMGKLRLRKGQPVAVGWVKVRDVSDAVEEWLVR